jgi:hypothetical protein
MTVQFQIGKTYQSRSLCDHNCIFSFTILARTAKTITFDSHGKTQRRGVNVVDGAEYCRPLGTYSMCPSIRADREIY